uniref:Small ribosomal subunit protein uS14 n=1 Tax=Piliocolobus tephrosceles TaxID=591936 RepID=A0A8C9G9D8_9PRIM
MGHQQLYWSHPRKFGQGSRSCRVCSNRHGLIRKYGLNMCRQCFRQYAKDIGFIKVGVCRRAPRLCGRRSWWFFVFSAKDNRHIFLGVVIVSIRPRAFPLF